MKHNKNWYLRIIAIALCALISFAYTPLAASAETGTRDEQNEVVASAAPKQEGRKTVTVTESVEMENMVPSIQTADDNELLMQYLNHEVAEELDGYPAKPGAKKSLNKQSRQNNLTGVELNLYNKLEEKIKAVASGELSDTEFSIPASTVYSQLSFSAEELGVEDILVKVPGGDYEVSKEAKEAFKSKFAFDVSAVTDSLLADLPYELYWFDKTKTGAYTWGISYSYYYRYDDKTDTEYLEADEEMEVLFDYRVSADYSEPEGQLGGTTVDTTKTKAAAAFVSNTAAIISENEDKDDLEKLKAYKDAICDATDYNYSALTTPEAAYGNPWQLIWVFDDDPNTKVVCEGYSKAFQFLCDQSAFSNTKVEAYTVTGTMVGGTGAGGHMWNIMHMEDGNNYLVDVTNCDDGYDEAGEPDISVGYPDMLFMKGALADGSVQNGYAYDCDGDGEGDISYIYDEDTTNLFATEELEMSTSAYVPSCQHVWVSTGVTKEAKCTETGIEGFECSACHATKTKTIPALGHNLTAHEAISATCTTAGSSAYWDCDRCEKFFSDEEGENEIKEDSWVIGALGHDTKYNAAVAPSCIADGNVEYWHCDRCKKNFNDEAGTTELDSIVDPKKDHTPTATAAKAATCEEAGNNAYWTCSVCKKVFKNEACTEETTVEAETSPALKHLYGDWEVLDDKQHVKICSRNEQHILKEDHTWDAGKETVAPTETTPGEKTFKCTKCSAEKKEPIPQIPSQLDIAKENARAELAKIDVSKYSGAERTAVEKAIKEALEKIDSATSLSEVDASKDAAITTINAQKTDAKKAEEAAAKKKAAREGTIGAGMPKVKLKKLSAKKNKITIKWTKLTSKQIKKSKATSYEIWVSASSKYPEGATTKEKILKKSKASWTCGGLKKNTKYYVKIRAIKYVKGAKVTGKWKQKTIKTKKK